MDRAEMARAVWMLRRGSSVDAFSVQQGVPSRVPSSCPADGGRHRRGFLRGLRLRARRGAACAWECARLIRSKQRSVARARDGEAVRAVPCGTCKPWQSRMLPWQRECPARPPRTTSWSPRRTRTYRAQSAAVKRSRTSGSTLTLGNHLPSVDDRCSHDGSYRASPRARSSNVHWRACSVHQCRVHTGLLHGATGAGPR